MWHGAARRFEECNLGSGTIQQCARFLVAAARVSDVAVLNPRRVGEMNNGHSIEIQHCAALTNLWRNPMKRSRMRAAGHASCRLHAGPSSSRCSLPAGWPRRCPASRPPPRFRRRSRPTPLQRSRRSSIRYCLSCHNQRLRTAGLALDGVEGTSRARQRTPTSGSVSSRSCARARCRRPACRGPTKPPTARRPVGWKGT